jgi:hypothetical protein
VPLARRDRTRPPLPAAGCGQSSPRVRCIRRDAIAASRARPHAARATRPPPPATASEGGVPGGQGVCHIQRSAIVASPARLRAARPTRPHPPATAGGGMCAGRSMRVPHHVAVAASRARPLAALATRPASQGRIRAARATRLPPPTMADGGHPHGDPRVRHIWRIATLASRARPRAARAMVMPASRRQPVAGSGRGRPPADPGQAWPSRLLVRVAVAARRDHAPPTTSREPSAPPPSPPLSSVVPSGRPGRWVGLPVFSRSREPVCATGGLGPRPSGTPWRPTSGYTRWGAWSSLKPARFPLCRQGNCHSRCPFGRCPLERTLRVAACQID